MISDEFLVRRGYVIGTKLAGSRLEGESSRGRPLTNSPLHTQDTRKKKKMKCSLLLALLVAVVGPTFTAAFTSTKGFSAAL
eukprot:7921717-Ditylum_brightwellii.AAC.1